MKSLIIDGIIAVIILYAFSFFIDDLQNVRSVETIQTFMLIYIVVSINNFKIKKDVFL